MKSRKTAIRDAFAGASSQYDAVAVVQRQAADELAKIIAEEIPVPKVGSWIDLGCGTGFLSQALLKYYPQAEITLNDLTPLMIEKGGEKIKAPYPIHILSGDLEQIEVDQVWDLVASNFVWQWLEDPCESLAQWSRRSKHLAISVLCDGSFSEWDQLHDRLGLPSRLRQLPSMEQIAEWAKSNGASPFQIQGKVFSQTVQSPLDFARQLREMGASLPESGDQPQTLLRLARAFPGPLTLSWNVAFLVIKGEKQD